MSEQTTDAAWLREFADTGQRDRDCPFTDSEAEALRKAADEIERLQADYSWLLSKVLRINQGADERHLESVIREALHRG